MSAGNILETDGKGHWIGHTIPLAEAMVSADHGNATAAAEVARLTAELDTTDELEQAQKLARFIEDIEGQGAFAEYDRIQAARRAAEALAAGSAALSGAGGTEVADSTDS